MAPADIQAVLREFDPIRRAIAQPEGTDRIEVSASPIIGMPSPAQDDRVAMAYFCFAAGQMLAADHGFPDTENYTWISDSEFYGNSFEVWCQSSIVNLLIGLWEQRKYRCGKPIIARNVHTGGYHIETYETDSAYFICISYQYLNLVNRYSLLNHYVIEASGGTSQVSLATATNEVAGQAIERAIRTKWDEICPYLDGFLSTAAKASDYQASEVFLNKHIVAATEQFYTSERYAHLRDATRLMAEPFYLPPEAMWTLYSDEVMNFTLGHEMIHIVNDDIKRRGRSTAEEMGADMGAASLLGYMTISTARRQGHRPAVAGIVMGPVLFFALSRIFAYLDDFDGKYRVKNLDMASTNEAMKEELTLLQRSIWVAGYLAGARWLTDPSAALFWNITGELRLLEIALRRRRWQLGGAPLPLPVEHEIAMAQDLMQRAKQRTEHDVTKFWENQNGSQP